MYGSLSPLHKKNPALIRGRRRGRKRHLKICWIRKNNTQVQKEKRKFRRRLFTTSIIRERRHFPVVVVQWRRRSVQKSVTRAELWFCFLDKIKWNSKTPSPPNQGWSRAKGKNAPFSHPWFGGGEEGSRFSIYFVQDCSFFTVLVAVAVVGS